MRFSVNFTVEANGSSFAAAVNVHGRYSGIEDVDLIRSRTIKDLDLDKIDSMTCGLKQVVVVVAIDEVRARSTSLFKTTNCIDVIVLDGQLNPYVENHVRISRDSKTDLISSVLIDKEVNTELVLAAWIEAGSPLVWNL